MLSGLPERLKSLEEETQTLLFRVNEKRDEKLKRAREPTGFFGKQLKKCNWKNLFLVQPEHWS